MNLFAIVVGEEGRELPRET